MDSNQKHFTPPAHDSIAPTPSLSKQSEKLPATQHTSWGAAIGIIIIISVLLIGALYFWGARLVEQDAMGIAPEKNPSSEGGEASEVTDFEF